MNTILYCATCGTSTEQGSGNCACTQLLSDSHLNQVSTSMDGMRNPWRLEQSFIRANGLNTKTKVFFCMEIQPLKELEKAIDKEIYNTSIWRWEEDEYNRVHPL